MRAAIVLGLFATACAPIGVVRPVVPMQDLSAGAEIETQVCPRFSAYRDASARPANWRSAHHDCAVVDAALPAANLQLWGAKADVAGFDLGVVATAGNQAIASFGGSARKLWREGPALLGFELDVGYAWDEAGFPIGLELDADDLWLYARPGVGSVLDLRVDSIAPEAVRFEAPVGVAMRVTRRVGVTAQAGYLIELGLPGSQRFESAFFSAGFFVDLDRRDGLLIE